MTFHLNISVKRKHFILLFYNDIIIFAFQSFSKYDEINSFGNNTLWTPFAIDFSNQKCTHVPKMLSVASSRCVRTDWLPVVPFSRSSACFSLQFMIACSPNSTTTSLIVLSKEALSSMRVHGLSQYRRSSARTFCWKSPVLRNDCRLSRFSLFV